METDYRKALCVLIDKGLVTTEQVRVAVNKAKELQIKENQNSKTWQSAYRLADSLHKAIIANGNKTFRINRGTMGDIEYLIRVCNYTEQEIQGVIDYSQESDFWCAIILSPEKLRKHFDQLYIRYKQDAKVAPMVDRTEDVVAKLREFDRRWEERKAEAVPMPANFKDVFKRKAVNEKNNDD